MGLSKILDKNEPNRAELMAGHLEKFRFVEGDCLQDQYQREL